jgi:hypothetical protein
MKARRNRYDLSLWDLRKLSLYGRVRRSVQNGSQFASFGRVEIVVRVSFTRVDQIMTVNYGSLIFSTSTKTE